MHMVIKLVCMHKNQPIIPIETPVAETIRTKLLAAIRTEVTIWVL